MHQVWLERSFGLQRALITSRSSIHIRNILVHILVVRLIQTRFLVSYLQGCLDPAMAGTYQGPFISRLGSNKILPLSLALYLLVSRGDVRSINA